MKIKSIQYHIIFLLLFLLGCGQEENGLIETQDTVTGEFTDENTYRVYPKDGDNFDVAEFRLWVSEENDKPRAILVVLSSDNSNALGLAYSAYWQEYATKEKLAILSVHLKTTSPSIGHYAQAELGSGKALLEAVNHLATKYEALNLQNLPFLLRGYSAGGVFSYFFSAFKPDRVIAFANIRGGAINLTPDNHRSVPGIIFYGENDAEQRRERIIEVVALKREIGAVWTVVREPNVDHFGSLGKPDHMIQTFFSKAIENRAQENSNELLDPDEEKGWLGNNLTFDIYAFAQYPGTKKQTSWLFDEEFALLWHDFQLN